MASPGLSKRCRGPLQTIIRLQSKIIFETDSLRNNLFGFSAGLNFILSGAGCQIFTYGRKKLVRQTRNLFLENSPSMDQSYEATEALGEVKFLEPVCNQNSTFRAERGLAILAFDTTT